MVTTRSAQSSVVSTPRNNKLRCSTKFDNTKVNLVLETSSKRSSPRIAKRNAQCTTRSGRCYNSAWSTTWHDSFSSANFWARPRTRTWNTEYDVANILVNM